VRGLILLVLWLALASPAFAADDEDTAPPSEPTEPSGPMLVAADPAPLVCDADVNRLQFLELRGTGFDAWALQRLSGSVVDGAGRPLASWSSVWVSPQGRLTLELNLCADRLRGRPALEPGSYTVQVGPAGGAAIAATSVELATAPVPEAGDAAMPAPAPQATTPPAADTTPPVAGAGTSTGTGATLPPPVLPPPPVTATTPTNPAPAA
jgi:hypothetical protein